MPFTSAAHTGSTEATVISSIVQESLRTMAVIRPTVTDRSSMAEKGVKTIELPKFSSQFGAPSAQNPDGATSAPLQNLAFAVDTLNLDQWKNLPYRIQDRISIQSRIQLEAELAREAGKEMALDIDNYILARLREASAAAPDHIITLEGNPSGVAEDAITLAGINQARALLKKQNVTDLDGGLTLLVSVEQEKNMLNIANFIQADQYGSREALMNGEIGRVYGMRVLVSNLLSDAEAVCYHRSCCAFAAQKEVAFERQRGSVQIPGWEYSFQVGYGAVTLDGGKRQVLLNDSGA